LGRNTETGKDATMTSTATIPARRMEPGVSGSNPSGLALAVADVCWSSTENLFREIDRDSVKVLMLKCLDYVNGWRSGMYPWSRSCRRRQSGPARWEQQFILPSGWMKRYPRLGMRPLARAIGGWWANLPSSCRRGLIMSYPHYVYLRARLCPDVSVYYNVDDYALYWPREADRIRRLEREMVRLADVTICVSRLRADELRACVPEVAGRIHHIPHGAPKAFLAPSPMAQPAEPPGDLAHLPRPLLGYIGSLEDRVDWELMDRLSHEFPRSSIVVLGRVRAPVKQPWWESCARFLARPNVHAVGWRPQETLGGYYRAFDISLIPYRMEHPFNRACSPTKIMDAMGSGRPIVATAIPECRLHAERFHVANNGDEFVRDVRQILNDGCDDGRAALRHAYAETHSCREVGERIVELIMASSG
jgi:glycosyltransferase involved in cell wall biosynthesis